jgi:hypothetical protein
MGGHFDPVEMLRTACIDQQVNLSALVAATALWAHPETHLRQLRQNGTAAVYPNVRRLRPGQGEKRGIVDGVRLDDNTYPNSLLKRRLGVKGEGVVGFECCHIWPNSCYDTRYHTIIANLVLVPAALASLTDHYWEVQSSLQYRAYELYGWHPAEAPTPLRPVWYPEYWREPQPDPLHSPRAQGSEPGPSPNIHTPVESVDVEKLRRWAANPNLIVHHIIALMCNYAPISRRDLVRKVETLGISQNPYGAVAGLMINAGNSFGLVFIEDAGKLIIHPKIEEDVRHLWERPTAYKVQLPDLPSAMPS